MKKLLTLSFLFSWCLTAYTNAPYIIKQTLDWEANPTQFVPYEGAPAETIWKFEGAAFGLEETPSLPFFFKYFPVDGAGLLNVEIVDVVYEDINLEGNIDREKIGQSLSFDTQISSNRGAYKGYLAFVPIIRNGSGQYQKVVSFELKVDFIPSGPSPTNRGDNTYNSKLSDGTIYKIAVQSSGIHKIDANFLSNELGIDLSSVDPRRIQILGNGGGMLPNQVGQTRADDLIENAIWVSGESDGSFDAQDFILFFAEGPSTWYYDADRNTFQQPINVYDKNNYYFIKIGSTNGLRVGQQASVGGSAYTTTSFNDYLRYESDQYNLLFEYDLAQGSGSGWVGDYFKNQTTYSYPDFFTFPNLDTESAVILEGRFHSRSESNGNFFSLSVAGQPFSTTSFSSNDTGNPNATFAYNKEIVNVFQTNSSVIPVTVTFNKSNPVDEGWLDYIQMNCRRRLTMVGDQMAFRDRETTSFPVSTFQLTTAGAGLTIWDITDPLKPVEQNYDQNGNTLSFGANTLNLREFVAFNQSGSFASPDAIGQIENQNIHGIDNVDMIIIYHQDFLDQAQRLADHRQGQDGLNIELVNIEHIWNEFGSGRRDVTAIRDFAEMVYSRTTRFKYLLLFGDGSFDHRNIEEIGKNYIPTFETPESNNPINSFPSDDYYGLLDEGEGSITNNDQLDISVGRIPVNDNTQATIVVDKIINYETNSNTLGDWRNRMTFVADDGDGNDHTEDADDVSELIAAKYPNLNIDKIYLDAYNQVPTPGGERVPGATDALNQNMFKGLLAVTYLGHGGSKGWAQERVLQIPDINSWTNFENLPIFITATCSFAGFDDPGFTTAGEEILLNRRGGAVALYSTTRAVYASLNKELTLAVADTLFYKPENEARTLGDIFR
ncbi:MAG: type IX secretion system sortase PorU, partial [Bacteroidota bacterium]